MLIKFKNAAAGNKTAAKSLLAARLPGANVKETLRGFVVSGFRPGQAADAAPLLENLPGVAGVEFSVPELCPLACAARPAGTIFNFSRGPFLIAGPCAVEDEASYLATAAALKKNGAHALRAALFKPRSSPYAFQGLGFAGAPILAKARKLTGLPLVTEAVDTRHVERLSGLCDALQIGARNMRNYELLKEAGAAHMPVLLKRSMQATLREWLLSAEYLLKYGARGLMLCERGDSGPSSGGRGPDLDLLLEAKKLTGLPVLADPSHSTHDRILAARLALKAVKAGADGLLIEASLAPLAASVDGRQTMTVQAFAELAGAIKCKKRS